MEGTEQWLTVISLTVPDPKPKGMGVRGFETRKDGGKSRHTIRAGSIKTTILTHCTGWLPSLGADTFYDPMFGGNLLNAGAKNVVGADGINLINAFNQIKNAKRGIRG